MAQGEWKIGTWLTEVHEVSQGVQGSKEDDEVASQLVQLDGLIQREEWCQPRGAEPCDPSTHHQDDHQHGVKAQTLAAPPGNHHGRALLSVDYHCHHEEDDVDGHIDAEPHDPLHVVPDVAPTQPLRDAAVGNSPSLRGGRLQPHGSTGGWHCHEMNSMHIGEVVVQLKTFKTICPQSLLPCPQSFIPS